MIVKNLESGFGWTPDMSQRAKRIFALFRASCILIPASVVIGAVIIWYQSNYGGSAKGMAQSIKVTVLLTMSFLVISAVISFYFDINADQPWALSDRDKSGLNRLEAANKYWMERGLDGEYLSQSDLGTRSIWLARASGAGAAGVYGVWTHPSGLRLRRVSYSEFSLDGRTISFYRTEHLELSLDGKNGDDEDTTILTLYRDRDQEPVCDVIDDFDRVLLWPILQAFEHELAAYTEPGINSVADQVRNAILNADRLAKIGAKKS
jgi:hypothetical protein